MGEPLPRATIRNPSEDEQPQLLELLVKAFRRWPHFAIHASALDHLRWKMRSDPIAGRNHWVAVVDDRIVAMLLRIVRRARVNGRDYLVRDSVDVAVDPEHQSLGLYGAVLQRAMDDPVGSEFDLALWFSSNPKTRRRSLSHLRTELANTVQVLEKPCHARALVARRRKEHGARLPAWLAVLRIKLTSARSRIVHPPHWRAARRDWSISTLDRFDERTDRFFDEAARSFDFLVVRHKDYMNWRYRDPAAARFTVRVAEQGGDILGYLVLKVSQGEGYIADLLALPERSDVVRSMIEDALRLFREAGVERISCWMITGHPYNGILRRYGFIDTRRDVGFAYMKVREDDDDFDFLAEGDARIHLTHGDSDWI